MKRDQELVEFEVDPATGEVRVIDASADVGLIASADLARQGGESFLTRLVKRRALSSNRPDMDDILASFDAKSPVDLVLRGHGLSLSDQYWYRAPGSTEHWENISFFDNGWDTSFGEAVLSSDYDRLATCSPDVPDVTTGGHATKAWERNDEGTVFLVKVSERYEGAELRGVKLASDLCAVLFGEGRYVPVCIVDRYDRPCSASPLMLASDEELADGNRISAMTGIQGKRGDVPITTEICDSRIKAYEAIGIADASAHVARMACFSCLALLADFHAGNFGAIRKVGSDAWRPAPIFDYDGSFGFPFNVGSIASFCANPYLAVLLCAQRFSHLRSSWDWSWYDPRALVGFENRIMEAYASYQDLPPNFTELLIRLFVTQRDYVNKVASGEWDWESE